MSLLATIGIIISIILIIYMTTKGLHIVIAGPLAGLIVILSNNMNIFDSLLGKEKSYMSSLAGFLINNFAIFLLGSILAAYMEKSGATDQIAKFILDKVGKDSPMKILIAITIIASVLTYGGISIFVVIFAIIPLSKPLFKELNISWDLFTIPVFLGASTYTLTMLPATPSVHNTIPTKVLGTSLTAAPLLSIVGSIVILIFGLFYMSYALKKSLNNNETFDNELDGNFNKFDNSKERPSILLSILPLLTLVTTIFLFSKVKNIAIIALTVSIILSAVIFTKYIDCHKNTLNNGTIASVMPAFATSSSVAFGSLLAGAAGFEIIRNFIMGLSDSPLVGLSLTTAFLSAITGSSSGAISIMMTNFIPNFMGMGLNPELLHRLVVVASAALTVVPQSGVMITFNALAGLSIKRGFKHAFIIVNVGHILALIVILILANFIY
ncbi:MULTISPECIES: GntP family permease [unclassified Gemella]|uniref:GntP family permease n=1 Tax=unclassified Gemella TaxID=2624949 RepID=UPI00107370D3|nr:MULTISPECIES: SLC13 family permease [unclassified Gemella]MBF0709819.1 GntP family permease [Gemella sp. GL1.1]MBF0747092.1 GntP family permease [Gemella sp. 19428wG2_WT2a]NYS27163.1 GntP family permease [Gemella sp. GL1]TFU58335.1 GntP family permease [Gemella sp. WT2a]